MTTPKAPEPQEPILVPLDEKPIEGLDDKKNLPAKVKGNDFALTKSPLNNDQIVAIRARTPNKLIRSRVGRGGKNFAYVPVSIYVRKLNFVFGYGAWSFRVIKSDIIEDHAIVQGELTVPGLSITVGQFGGHDVARDKTTKKAIDLGNTFKAATSDCLKKCCNMLGFFADVHSPEDFMDLPTPVDPAKQAEKGMDALLKLIAKADKKGILDAVPKIKESSKYTPAQKKVLLKAADARMSAIPDGEPIV